jgi:hypothetical protein
MPPKSWAWRQRVTFNPASQAGLDFGQELWKWDPIRYESAAGIRASLSAVGRPADTDAVMYYVTRNLVMDVIDAAGGIERAHARFTEAMATAQATYEQWQQQHLANNPGYVPSTDTGMADESVEDAWYSLEEMLIWTRILEDRLKRNPPPRTRLPDQGLIPALSDGPRRNVVIAVRDRLTAAAFDEARHFANLNLHAHPISLGTKNARVRNGRVGLDFPDAVTAPIHSSVELTYNSRRDGLAIATTIMAAVERFMDEMLTAFETNVPPRFRPQTPLQGCMPRLRSLTRHT